MKLIIFTTLITFLSCNAKTSDKNTDSMATKEILQPQSNIHIDSVNNFKIAYPSNWTQVTPTSSKTVFKIGNLDSMLSLSVNIQEKEAGIDNLPLSEESLAEKTKVLSAAHISMGDKIMKLKVLNYDIGIRKVVATIWYQAIKVSDNNNIINVSNDFEFNVGDKRYSISLKGPVKYLDEKTSMYYIEKYVESFRIINESKPVVKSANEEQRNTDGLLLKTDLILNSVGVWKAEGSSMSLSGLKFYRTDFKLELKNDATGKMQVVVVLDKIKGEILTLSFDVYPWGIVNNKNNVDMFYFSITNGKLINSTIKDTDLKKSISNKFINTIYKTRGLTAELKSLDNGIMELTNLQPNEFYPKTFQKL